VPSLEIMEPANDFLEASPFQLRAS
jgi:hypothetical protein